MADAGAMQSALDAAPGVGDAGSGDTERVGGADLTAHGAAVPRSPRQESRALPISTQANPVAEEAPVCEEKNREPDPPPPPPRPTIQRRLLELLTQRETPFGDISAKIRNGIKRGAKNTSEAPPCSSQQRETEVKKRPEILRTVASCFAGCLATKSSATPANADDDEQYAPLFEQRTDSGKSDAVDPPQRETETACT